MSAGFAKSVADQMLDVYPSSFWVQLHTGDPGGDGTYNQAFLTERAQGAFDPSSDGFRSMPATVDWDTAWAGGEQQVTHLTFWTSQTGGAFLMSLKLSAPVFFFDGATPRLRLFTMLMKNLAAD